MEKKSLLNNSKLKNIVVMVSGGGTNLQALINAQNEGRIQGGRIHHVISSRYDAFAVQRAKSNNIPVTICHRKHYEDLDQYFKDIDKALDDCKADIIVQAGFMSILPKYITDKYPYKIINVHPALIPSFCGKGFYGLHVHDAVIKCGVKVTGATVHFVNENVDAGAILLQKAIDVYRSDTAESLQKRVMEECEWVILPEAVSLLCTDMVEIIDGRSYIKA